ncbi:MAG TPA: hypothetical protein PLM07_14930 [Candidatus Rifleibacterium sp.]|nr:hypothetical protein [Candidatus Rifleibacterium sp.]
MPARKNLLFLSAAFVVAMLSGFIFASGSNRSEVATNESLAREMARVIRTLEPLRKSASDNLKVIADQSVPEILHPVIQRGLLQSLPNGDWQWKRVIPRGEGLYFFSRLLETLSLEMREFPVLIRVETEYADIGPAHWLKDALQLLAGTGALHGFGNGRLFPDMSLQQSEVKQIGSALIEYLGSNCLLIVFDGKAGKVRAKGALSKIDLKGWRYSFERRNWFELDAEGCFYPNFAGARQQSIFFDNPAFIQNGSFKVEDGIPSAGLIKIQKKYVEKPTGLAENVANVATAATASVSLNNAGERQILKERLKELQAKHRVRQPAQTMVAPEYVPQPAFEQTVPTVPLNENSGLKTPALPEAADESVAEQTSVEPVVNLVEDKQYEGCVNDAVTGLPVAGAVVMVGSQQFSADSEGRFKFSTPENAVVEVTAYSEGYEAISLRHRAGYRAGPLRLAIKPVMSGLSGKVVHSESGNAMAKVLVKLGIRATRTDAEGQFSFKGIKPGYHQVSCFARGFMEAHEIVHVGNQPVENFAISVRPIFEEYSAAQTSEMN